MNTSELKKRVLVTGGAGFIGSHIVSHYQKSGYEVIVIDNESTGKKSRLNEDVVFFNADIRDEKALRTIFTKWKPHIVNHHAAHISLEKSITHPIEDAEINILGSLAVYQACKEYSVELCIFASSGGALFPNSLYADENTPPAPSSPYGVSKYSAENYLKVILGDTNCRTVIFRYSNVFGPGQSMSQETGVIGKFCEAAVLGKTLLVHGTGEQTRDFVYVEDVARASLLATQNEHVTGTFHIGTGIETTIADLAQLLTHISNSKSEIEYITSPYAQTMRSSLNADKAKVILGWQPQFKLSDGLENTLAWERSA